MTDLSGLNVAQFRARVVEPAIGKLAAVGVPAGEAAIRLVLGTAAQESGFRDLSQIKGPALGLFQIEPATLNDLLANFVNYRPALGLVLQSMAAPWPLLEQQLASNLVYAAAVCRLIYFRAPDPLPDADDIDGMGKLWKRLYNTATGAGTVGDFVSNYRRFISGS